MTLGRSLTQPVAYCARWGILCAVVLWAGCENGNGNVVDAGRDSAGTEVGTPSNPMTGPLSIDFTASGCVPRVADNGIDVVCAGAAPLTVDFVPIASGDVSSFLWRFGDGSQLDETTPSHTYTLPGQFDVVLVGGGSSGSVSRQRTAFIEVVAGQPGQWCDVTAQCAEGLVCRCGSEDDCAPEFTRGICTTTCEMGSCAATGDTTPVCADLGRSGAMDEKSPWRAPLCLQPCETDTNCSAGLKCRDLPARAPAAGWVRACFVDMPVAAGQRCRASNGLLDQSACVTGVCLDLGAFGMCTPSCEDEPCPSGTKCALFSSGQTRHCVPLCSDTALCNQDPLLACQAPDRLGPRGFTVATADPADTFCMPKVCSDDSVCGAAGSCSMGAGGGHCVSN